jgi:Tfp pilus assembly protein PilF
MRSFAAQICLSLLVLFAISGCKKGGSSEPGGKSESAATSPAEQFLSLMNAGKNYFDQGDSTNALTTYRKAVALVPNDVGVHLNLANAHLMAGDGAAAIREADEALKLEPNSATAYFIKGSGHLRLSNFEDAVKALENARRIDPGEIATFFQLGVARIGLKQWDAAIAVFQEGLRIDPNHLHAAAHYLLGQSLLRAGRQEEAQKELQLHQANGLGGPGAGAATFEKSKFTQVRVPFKLEQPNKIGIAIKFSDATSEVFGGAATNYAGPIGVLDLQHKGWNSLFVRQQLGGFRLLVNTNGLFVPHPGSYPSIAGANYSKMLVGDLQNDRFEDVIVLGDKGSHLFKFATNGVATDVSLLSRLNRLQAVDGLVMDLDFTGKLDLLVVTATNDVRIFRQFGPLLFNEITSTSGIPSSLQNAQALTMEDWNRDQVMDVLVARKTGGPLVLEKQRGGALVSRELTNAISGSIMCSGDFDNDLRPDLAVLGNGKITIIANSGEQREIPLGDAAGAKQLVAVDYDNDGWLDLWLAGPTLRAWRNTGVSGFQEQTAALGLDKLGLNSVSEIHFADFDMDCDPDVVVALADGGLRYLRNDGGHANSQVKVHLFGNRSNASGLGCRVEIESGGLRLIRTVQQLPVEIGVGKYQKLDSFLVHWFNWPQGSAEVAVNCKEPLFAFELTIQEGSCPYLYAWDGKQFRFVTDILGAAPLGLPLAAGRYIDADPEEIVWIGNEQSFPARDGKLQLQITEELREVLYLDEAKLMVVDHEPGTEVHSTDKLLPGKPFPKGELMTLQAEHRLRRAETLDRQDVTRELLKVDDHRVSPRVLSPQLRGMAEPHGLVLDFGDLDTTKPLVLVLNGWLRFGGGMANIAASHDPSLPYPFPVLEAEGTPGSWKKIDVTMGAPAGKTKTILVDLEGKLPAGTRRLRFTEAFEIHWDRIALMEKKRDAATVITYLTPAEADLHFRGFSSIRSLRSSFPLTPEYDLVTPNSYWTVIPGGWCTRYGDAAELIERRDEGLALLNSGDELSLSFDVNSLSARKPGLIRDYFLYVDGWDKDSDFHVAAGTEVEPLPFHGMDDQRYGRERRPNFASDHVHRKYNTRWVEGRALKRETVGK